MDSPATDAPTPAAIPAPAQAAAAPERPPPPPVDASDPAALEHDHVHAVYDQIAGHFSNTRYKPWPVVDRFLRALPPGCVGVDAGCGNGKYLGLNPTVFLAGSDRSPALAALAVGRPASDVAVADILDLPHPPGRFDFAISVAVVHHLATPERRQAALAALVRLLRPDGQALVSVWALEQSSSRRGWGAGQPQDVMVPWVLQSGEVHHRYYHLYCEGELENDARAVGARIVGSGYERDNWWAILSP
ncbi:putative trna (uracil-5-)-methyltransferase trm9 protein [Dipodascopsis tothii]|uniref:putative trna (uracil-5-)-methyltransferase trm9 protein n=1 Tax=Dipodascopsis tothii TaxID=44089 RepID=UPI0034CDE7E1